MYLHTHITIIQLNLGNRPSHVEIDIFWDVMPCQLVYTTKNDCFAMKTEAICSSKMSVDRV
jgi:hypothetical protein